VCLGLPFVRLFNDYRRISHSTSLTALYPYAIIAALYTLRQSVLSKTILYAAEFVFHFLHKIGKNNYTQRMNMSLKTGVFIDTAGLSYRSGDVEGKTDAKGKFSYIDGEDVIFSIGTIELGRCQGKPQLSVLDLVVNPNLESPQLLNRGRLLFSLTTGQGFEKVITLDEKVRVADLAS
jgi:hypothetical protein